MKLHGKVAVVTGGLRGIGHAIALAMAQEGADILIAGLSMDRAAQTEQEIRTLGRRCVVVQADVADEEAVKAMIARMAYFLAFSAGAGSNAMRAPRGIPLITVPAGSCRGLSNRKGCANWAL